jgi:glycosyltransferase involved in cell wall biosynthesis
MQMIKQRLKEYSRAHLKQWFGSKFPETPILKSGKSKHKDSTIYYVAPDNDQPSGGTRTLYRHVDILNAQGFEAAVVHVRKGFSYTWFDHRTRIEYARDVCIGPSDIVVVPEIYVRSIRNLPPGTKTVVFSQGAYLTFAQETVDSSLVISNYLGSRDLLAIMVVSDDSAEYLRYAFPSLRVERVHQSIDFDTFYPSSGPHGRRIAFMPRRYLGDIVQVVQLLRARNALRGWELSPIHNCTPAQAAEKLRASAIFLTANHQEGFGLPPVEAMASGCVVAGFPGHGGREYLQPEWSFPVEQGDVRSLAHTIERLIHEFEANPIAMQAMAARGAEYIRAAYSPSRERADILSFFGSLLVNRQPRKPSEPNETAGLDSACEPAAHRRKS